MLLLKKWRDAGPALGFDSYDCESFAFYLSKLLLSSVMAVIVFFLCVNVFLLLNDPLVEVIEGLTFDSSCSPPVPPPSFSLSLTSSALYFILVFNKQHRFYHCYKVFTQFTYST